jgi:LysM repeat protein
MPEPTIAPAPPAVSPTATMVPPGQPVAVRPGQTGAGDGVGSMPVDGLASGGATAPQGGRTISVGPDGVPVSEHAVDLSMVGRPSGDGAGNGATSGQGLGRVLGEDFSQVPINTTIDTRDISPNPNANPGNNAGAGGSTSSTDGGVIVIEPSRIPRPEAVRRGAVGSEDQQANRPTNRPDNRLNNGANELPLTSGRLMAHPVKSGDTLIALARRYYGDESMVERLAAYNKGRVGSRNALRVGVTLRIPPRDVLMGRARLADDASATVTTSAGERGSTARSTTAGRPAGSPTSTPASTSPTTYTVKGGDTLGSIARATLGTSKRWREIYDANRSLLPDEDSVTVGMKLKIPAR